MRVYVDPSTGGDFFWPGSLVPVVIAECSQTPLELTSLSKCQLAIYGPYESGKTVGYLDRVVRKLLPPPRESCVSLYVTMENSRPDLVKYDFCIGSDFGINAANFCRMPYWWCVLDWPCLTKRKLTYSRYGQLLSIDRLMQPLGCDFLHRNGKAALMCRHLKEPRQSLYKAVQKQIPVDGFGAPFQGEISHHNRSGIVKSEILSAYSYNLCPENSMHPGYYTEKIPEAFHSGCLPLSWADLQIGADFNPQAFVNLYRAENTSADEQLERLQDRDFLRTFAEQPLLRDRPTLNPLYAFIEKVVSTTLS